MKLILQTYTADTIPPRFKKRYDTSARRMGELLLGNGESLFTVERPFISNPDAPVGFNPGKPFVSSVPLGEYDLVMRDSPSKGSQWHFFNDELGVMLEKSDCTDLDDDGQPTWQRYSTMFHIGNFVSSVVGCAGVGLRLHNFPGPHGLGVASSAIAMHKLKACLDDGSTHHQLVIK